MLKYDLDKMLYTLPADKHSEGKSLKYSRLTLK